MGRVWVAGLAATVLSCGGGGGGTPQPPPTPAPTISLSANPGTIVAGQSSTLSWTTTNATSVSISPLTGSFTTSGTTSVSPDATTTYTATASGSGGSASASATVTVTTSVPTVSGFNPTSGPVGTVVTVNGTNFSNASAVKFNGTAAVAFSVTSATQLTATVPPGATSGTVAVTTSGGTGTSTGSFTVTSAGPLSVSITANPALPPVTQAPLPVMTRLTMTANVSGGAGPFTYLWKKGGQTIPGATGASLTIPSLLLSDQGEYTVEVRDSALLLATSPVTKLFVWTVANVDFKPLGIAMKGTVQFSTAPDLDQVRVQDTKTGDRLGPVQLPSGSRPTGVTIGTDGNVWVTLNGTGEVARISPQSLAIQRWAVGEKPFGIASASTGEIWFTLQGQNKVGRIPAVGGIPTTFDASANSRPEGLTLAGDGTVWFTERDLGMIGRIKPGANQVEEWKCAHANARPEEILATDSGKVYYNDKANAAVVAFSVSDQVQGSAPLNENQVMALRRAEIRDHPDLRHGRSSKQNLLPATRVERAPAIAVTGAAAVIVHGGLIRTFAYGLDPQGGPAGIAADGQGNVWLTQQSNGKVLQLSSDGTTHTYVLPSSLSKPSGIVVGSTGQVWVTLAGTNQIAQVPTSQPIIVKINATEPKRALKGEILNFNATVTGAIQDPSVNWELLEGSAAGAITQSGAYTASNTPGTYHIIARSKEDPSKFGRLSVVVYPWPRWPQGTVQVLAGHVDGVGNVDGPGLSARLNFPNAVCADPTGNIFISDGGNRTIRKLSNTGMVTTFAGASSRQGASDGNGRDARFGYPSGLVSDSQGNLYLADTDNHTIRKINPAGVVSTLAGIPGQPGWDDGPGATATFNVPSFLALDGSNNLFVSDMGNHLIRKVTPTGIVSRVAGVPGIRGSADGPATSATFDNPAGIVVDAAGTVYVSDGDGSTLRKISSGVVATLAGAYGLYGNQNGAGNVARFGWLRGLTVDPSGNLIGADWGGGVRKITPAGVVSTLPGSYTTPKGVGIDPQGRILVADWYGQVVSRFDPSSNLSQILVGTNFQLGNLDGQGAAAFFRFPQGMAMGPNGLAYVMDNNEFRSLSPSGLVTTVAGSGESDWKDGTGLAAKFIGPECIAFDGGGNAFITDNSTIRKITPAGVVSTIAGVPFLLGYKDGPAASAQFRWPMGLVFDLQGNLIIGDAGNWRLRGITPAGVVGSLGAGGLGRLAQLALDTTGNVLVADSSNNVIWKVTSTGNLTVLAGELGTPALADGSLDQARLFWPGGIAVDRTGRVFIADYLNHAIRVVTAEGFMATLVGDVDSGISRPGSLRDGSDLPLGPGYGSVAVPYGLTVTPDGSTVFVCSNMGILKVSIVW